MAQSTLRHPKSVMSALRRDFEMKDEQEILAFMERHPNVPSLLPEIRSAIRNYFGDDVVRLDVVYDPELEDGDPDPALFANIRTASDDALVRLKRFDHEWWLERLKQSSAPVVVSIHHVGRV